MIPAATAMDRNEGSLVTGVLVIGGGFAGLCAAIEARLAGAPVLLLEPAPVHLRGGNARHSRNIRLANPAETPWQPGRYPADELQAELAAMGAPDATLAARLAEGSAELGPWLAGQGVAFEPWAEGNLPRSRRTRFFRGGGQALVNALYGRAERLGVAIRHGWRVEELDPASLDPDPEQAPRVRAVTPGGAQAIAAGAVVLACGGYGADRARLAGLLGPAGHGIANRGTPHQRGAPLLWALDHGAAAAGRPGDGHLVAVDARAPMDDAGIVSRVDGMQLGIVVGADGRRLRDEGATAGRDRHSVWGRLLAARPDPRAVLVLGAAAAARLPPMLHPPIAADTPEALARLCDIDPAGLSATVAEINAHLRGGPPPAIPRSRSDAAPLDPLTGELMAIPLQPGCAFTRHGVAVDDAARVRLAGGGVAPRLFAAGAAMCGAVLGEGYLSGLALTIGGVFGRIAGQNAAAAAGDVARATPPVRVLATPAVPTRVPNPPPEDPLAEARRTINICNTCGFCTGLCDVFPAAKLREGLGAGDLRHLAHLCHDCRSCYYDCQYAPPHELAVNVPAALAELRAEEYRAGLLPRRNATAVLAGVYLACLLGVPLAALLLAPPGALFSAHAGPGAFYAVIPHGVMASAAGLAFGGAALVLAVRAWRFWCATAGPDMRQSRATWIRALGDVLRLRNLGGGPPGCEDRSGPTGAGRRWAHHLVAYGFALTFLATVAGAVLHHGLGQIAPHPPLSLPVALGTAGGVAMLLGLAGLELRRRRADRAPAAARMERADRFTRASLALVAATGLALLALRDTPAMGLLLALHLGSVLGLAVTSPFAKLSHGVYRAAALLRHAGERAARERD